MNVVTAMYTEGNPWIWMVIYMWYNYNYNAQVLIYYSFIKISVEVYQIHICRQIPAMLEVVVCL